MTKYKRWYSELNSRQVGFVSKRKGHRDTIVKCPHCPKEGGIGAMKRYHFDNCKMSSTENERRHVIIICNPGNWKDVEEWCYKNIGNWTNNTSSNWNWTWALPGLNRKYFFLYEKDATMFALKWL